MVWLGLMACGVPALEEEQAPTVRDESTQTRALSANPEHRNPPPREPSWVRNITGTGEHETQVIAHDPRGNVLVLVTDIEGPLDFGAGPVILPYPVSRIAGLAKYSPGGELLWARVLAAQPTAEVPTSYTVGTAMAVDPKGNIVLGMHVEGRFVLEAIDVPTGDYLVKLDRDGKGLWARQLPTRATGVAIDDEGHIGINGFLQGAPGITFDFGDGPISAAKQYAFVARYSSRGELDWVFVDDEVVFTQGFATDEDGNFYFGGSRFPDIQSGAGTPYLRKVSCKGRGMWSRHLEASSGSFVSIAAHHDRVVAVGSFSGSFRFGGRSFSTEPEEFASMLLNFSQGGRERWGRQLDSTLRAVGMDHKGGVYVAGALPSTGGETWLFTARYFKESGNRDWELGFRDRFLFATDLSVTARGDLAITGPAIYVLQFKH
ncbi:hypothetical protein Q664_17970 [Archangium violaceum Cb vi76]|uniref:Uncharacterized protein n=2 Tax=Archangium violaceum TaxID=83451 RepID=A0A084SUP0_9BACT|nr:hypothetical protein Q664_17970 [Archangium violaceum Cb vi76]